MLRIPPDSLKGRRQCPTSLRLSAIPLSPSSNLLSPAPILGLSLSKPLNYFRSQLHGFIYIISLFLAFFTVLLVLSIRFFPSWSFFFFFTFLRRMRGEEKYHHLRHHQNHHRLRSFHLHALHLGHRHGHEKGKSPATTMPPKGWMGIRVGQEGEEEQRFEVPVEYLKHPLFMGLLHQAEEEFGYEQNGAITIPCGVDHFCHVQDTINRDSAAAAAHHHGHLPHLAGCFGA